MAQTQRDLARNVSDRVAQFEVVVRAIWGLAAIVAAVAAWATKLNIEVANNSHSLRVIQQELQARQAWMGETSESLARIDERLKALQETLQLEKR